MPSKEAGIMARIVELKQSAKENVELKARVTELEHTDKENAKLIAKLNHDIEEIKQVQIATNEQSALSTKYVAVQIGISMQKFPIH